ncbi:hypothetical protein AB0B45_46175 [Nonomuraea sp. NPDC049152]|uniref:hypothetical protein n=1 Tax=Nonomuraea sp. NPDC049152 TaxID=3154350 RepID=UPI00340EEDE4
MGLGYPGNDGSHPAVLPRGHGGSTAGFAVDLVPFDRHERRAAHTIVPPAVARSLPVTAAG